MDKAKIISYLERMDAELAGETELYIYGSTALMLLDEPGRTSLGIDVAGPYSRANQADFRVVAEKIGLPVNPEEEDAREHIEWVGPLRLCLPPPDATGGMVLWRGAKLTIRTGNAPDLVASKLIRYDETDRSDLQFLFGQCQFAWEEVRDAADRLPEPFRTDALVRDNLANLKTDLQLWKGVGK
jgi:hypothetical protein